MTAGAPGAVVPGVQRVPLPTPFRVGDVNCYLLDGGGPLTLVDPGPATAATEAALDAGLTALGRRVEDVELVFLTHQHPDHVGLAAAVRRRSGAEVAARAPLDRFLADVSAALDADDAYAAALMRRHGTGEATIALLRQRAAASRGFTASVPVDRVLADGDTLEAGGRRWRVAARPGHSPTDTTLRSEDGILIGGDHLLETITANPMAHVDLAAPDPAALAASPGRPRPLVTMLRSLRATGEDPPELVLPGHGEPFGGAAEVVEKRFAAHDRRARRILRALDAPRAAADVIETLWRQLPAEQGFLALSEVLGHLDLLADRGEAAEVDLGGGRVAWVRA